MRAKKKRVLCPISVQDNRLRDGDHKKNIQEMDAASLTKGLHNDVILNYKPLSPVSVPRTNLYLNQNTQIGEISQRDASLNWANLTAAGLLTVLSTFAC